ncbi:MAG: hypothetical protein PWR12_2003, partial [Eubacteriaceae bacterium]|nr:hypothetical protein [Eubacteriaceae bacterium]
MISLKQQFRLIMLGIVTIAMVMAGLLFLGEVLNVTDLVVKSYARLYNNEIVGEIDTYINREIGLAQKLSNTFAIQGFLKNSQSAEAEEAALVSVNEFNQIFYNNNTFMVPMATQDFYYLNGQVSEMIAEGHLEADMDQDAWYFDLLASDDDYRLKIDKDRFLGTLGLWINMKVYDQGQLIGVVGTQLSMEALIDNILIAYEQTGVKTLVVNESGGIELGSFDENRGDEEPGESQAPQHQQDQEDEHPTELITDYLPDFDLTAVQTYFETEDKGDSCVFDINYKGFEVSAIAPILDSGWYV